MAYCISDIIIKTSDNKETLFIVGTWGKIYNVKVGVWLPLKFRAVDAKKYSPE